MKTLIATIMVTLCFGVTWASDVVIYGDSQPDVIIETDFGYVTHGEDGIKHTIVIRDEEPKIMDADGNEYDNYRQYYRNLYDLDEEVDD